MTYTATLSSQGQVTIPVEARRLLGLKKRVVFDVRGDELVIKKEPSFDEIRARLKKSTTVPKLSQREKAQSEHYTKLYLDNINGNN